MSRKIAVIAIQHPLHEELYLHGLRRDNDSWCMPGGHFESGEDPVDAAKRELFEETGLTAELTQAFDHHALGYNDIPLHIFLFIGKDTHGNLTDKHDPDAEFADFKYLDPRSDKYQFMVPKDRNVLLLWQHNQNLQKSMFEDEDLSKAEKPPMVAGEVNSKGNVAVRHHKFSNMLTWEQGPETKQYFETLVNKNKDHFLSNFPAANKPALESLINKISVDPARHYVSTQNNLGNHDMRLRHIGSMIVGDKATSILPHPDGTVTISQERHGTNPIVSSWHVNHKGSVTDVSKQHNFQHPKGAQEFTQSLNRSRFGSNYGIFPQDPQKNASKLKFITSPSDKKIVKSEVQYDAGFNVSNDRRTISSKDSRASHQEVGRHDSRGTGTLGGLHRRNLVKSYAILCFSTESPVPPIFDSLGSNVQAISFCKNERQLPAVFIESPNDFKTIIKHAMDYDCEFIVMASENQSEILYTKGKYSGKMHVGVTPRIQKSEPIFGFQLNDQYIEYGSFEHIYLVPSPFKVQS